MLRSEPVTYANRAAATIVRGGNRGERFGEMARGVFVARDILDDERRQRLFDTVMMVDRMAAVSRWTDDVHALLAKE
jgi:hypothetical protein